MSSTAFALQTLAEKKQLTTRHGRVAFAILLFQDISVVPLLALVPLLAPSGTDDAVGGWLAAEHCPGAVVLTLFNTVPLEDTDFSFLDDGSLVQLIYAGPNGMIDGPDPFGGPGGDDTLVTTSFNPTVTGFGVPGMDTGLLEVFGKPIQEISAEELTGDKLFTWLETMIRMHHERPNLARLLQHAALSGGPHDSHELVERLFAPMFRTENEGEIRFTEKLGRDQPVFGLQLPGLDGRQPPLTRVQDMAAYLLEHIRQRCPDGPCHLAGYACRRCC